MKTLQDSITEIKNSGLYSFKLKFDQLVNEVNVSDNLEFALNYLDKPSVTSTSFDNETLISLQRYLNKKSFRDNDVPEELLKNILGDYYLILTVDLKDLGKIKILIFKTFTYKFEMVAKIFKNTLIETEGTYDKLYNHIASFLDVK